MPSESFEPIHAKHGGYGLPPNSPVAREIRQRLYKQEEEFKKASLEEAKEKQNQEKRAIEIAGEIPEPDPSKFECELRKSQRRATKDKTE